MDKEAFVSNRDFLLSIKHVNLNDGKERSIALHAMVDNEHAINTSFYPTVWDDANECAYVFGYNGFEYQSIPAMGTSKINNMGAVKLVPYDVIQQFIAVVSEEDTHKVIDAIMVRNPNIVITDEERQNIIKKLFRQSDPTYNILEARKNGQY